MANKKKKKKEKKSKTLSRIATFVIGIAFAGSTLAIALSSVFSQNNYGASHSDNSETAPSAEEQIQLQARGYEKVLEREPQNLTALEGLTQIYLQTGNLEKAMASLEKLVAHYPEQEEYADILELVKQRQQNQNQSQGESPEETTPTPAQETE